MASGGTCGCHTGRVTGPNHEGTSTAVSYPPTLQVVPAATPMSCPLGEVCVGCAVRGLNQFNADEQAVAAHVADRFAGSFTLT